MRLIITKTGLFILFLVANSVMAQSAREELISRYHNFRTESDPIFNGLEYTRYPFYISSGIPYFTSDTMTAGSVVYNGVVYKDIQLMYDMILDELIAMDYSGKNMIKLVKQKVEKFYLYGATFISVKNHDKALPDGYYQVVQQGDRKVFKKEIKYIKDKVKSGEDPEKVIESKVTYYDIPNSPVNQ